MERPGQMVALLPLLLGAVGCAHSPLLDSRALLPPYREEQLHAWQEIADDQERRAAGERWRAVVNFAPVIVQELRPQSTPDQERADFLPGLDYDGNWRGADNEDHLNARDGQRYQYALQATVYYAVVETTTHRFITYFLHHAVDWSPRPNFLWLGITHENDGEGLQVVTRKAVAGAPECVVLLATQAHLRTRFYAAPDAGIASGQWPLQPAPLPVTGPPNGPAGTHPRVRVSSGGHGIRGDVAASARARQEDYIVFTPADRTSAGDVWTPGGRSYTYRLVPLHDTLWRFYRTGRFIGNGGIMDGSFDYQGDHAVYRDLPRFFDSDRLSFFPIWKKDAGIVPFAFDGHLLCGPKGRLFFDPARAYPQQFTVPPGWSVAYIYNPYLPGEPPNR